MNGIGFLVIGGIITAGVLNDEAPEIFDAILDMLKGR